MFPPFKKYDEYSQDLDRRKVKGTKMGFIVHRIDPEKSKGSSWLAKVGGGYNRIDSGTFSSAALSDSHVIRESYAGNIYKIFIPDNVTKTRIFDNDNALEERAPKFLLGSKFIENFVDLEEQDRNQFAGLSEEERKAIFKDVTKARIVSAMLNEGDFEDKLANSGFQRRDAQLLFKKIDHGESLVLNEHGNSFSHEFSFPKPYSRVADFLDVLHLDPNVKEAIFWEAIDEIVHTDIRELDDVIGVHEELLSQCRDTHREHSYYMVGDEANRTGREVKARLACLTELNALKKSIDQKIVECMHTSSETDMSAYHSLLTEIKNIAVIDHPHIEVIANKLTQISDNLERDATLSSSSAYSGPHR